MILGIVLGLVIAFAMGMWGSRRTCGFWVPFVTSILLTPIVGLIVIIASSPESSYRKDESKVDAHQKHMDPKYQALIWTAVIVIVVTIYITWDNSKDKQQQIIVAKNEVKQEPPQIRANWEYTEEVNNMSEKTFYATSISVTRASFKFPYDGGSVLHLVIRKRENKANEIILKISKGQFTSNIVSENYLRVKFDDDKPMTCTYREEASGKTDVIFLNASNQFIKRLKKANMVVIEPTFYDEGSFQFCFMVDGLKWDK